MSKTPQDQKEIDRLRAQLEEKLRRPPEWINGASIQAVRDWKDSHKRASKTVLKKSPTATEPANAIRSVS
jgi:hypothetical protein